MASLTVGPALCSYYYYYAVNCYCSYLQEKNRGRLLSGIDNSTKCDVEVVIEMGVENHHPLSSEKVTLERTMLRELEGSLPLGDHKRVHGETTQSVKCVPCKHEDLCLIPKTHVKKTILAAVAYACISNTDKGTGK